MATKLSLTPSCELSTEHGVSSQGQPVLVNRATGAELDDESDERSGRIQAQAQLG